MLFRPYFLSLFESALFALIRSGSVQCGSVQFGIGNDYKPIEKNVSVGVFGL